MSTGVDEFALWDAAYVLGALSPMERRQFEEHLALCADCRAAVAELAGIPGLLSQVSAEDVVGNTPLEALADEPESLSVPPSDLVARVGRSGTSPSVSLAGGNRSGRGHGHRRCRCGDRAGPAARRRPAAAGLLAGRAVRHHRGGRPRSNSRRHRRRGRVPVRRGGRARPGWGLRAVLDLRRRPPRPRHGDQAVAGQARQGDATTSHDAAESFQISRVEIRQTASDQTLLRASVH